MRFILEHPWLAFVMISAVAFALTWTGLRDNRTKRTKIGLGVFCFAIIACAVGLLIDTPTEHSKRVIYGLVTAVEEKQYEQLHTFLYQDVNMVDHFKEISETGIDGIQKGIETLHRKHELLYNTVMRFQIIERDQDVLVELSLLSRVAGIGTVPSRWRILIMPDEAGIWKIYSIDAIEIMGRSYR